MTATLAGIGAIAMFVALFLNWYTASSGGETLDLDGFSAFEFVDVLLTLLAVAILGAVVADLFGRAVPGGQWSVLILGVIALVSVAFQLINKPPVLDFFGSAPGTDLTVTNEIGCWIALGGALAVTMAGLLNWGITTARS